MRLRDFHEDKAIILISCIANICKYKFDTFGVFSKYLQISQIFANMENIGEVQGPPWGQGNKFDKFGLFGKCLQISNKFANICKYSKYWWGSGNSMRTRWSLISLTCSLFSKYYTKLFVDWKDCIIASLSAYFAKILTWVSFFGFVRSSLHNDAQL